MMRQSHFLRNSPGLLVSVRSAAEALTALAGGADVIDVKEPDRGPLGAADPTTIADVLRAVIGRVPVTAAAGELLDFDNCNASQSSLPSPMGVDLYKIGLSGCLDEVNWQMRWSQIVATLGSQIGNASLPVTVAYADWRAARAPDPHDVLKLAIQSGCSALLIDTWDKSSGDLFSHWDLPELSMFVKRIRSHRIACVLAGSLNGPSIASAARLAPDFVAVRGAACEYGRHGTVTAQRVAAIKHVLSVALPIASM
jgi:uncharacterized protein (UPF0264 family)